VTPAGDFPTAPGAAVCELKTGVDVVVVGAEFGADDEDAPGPAPDEQPETAIEPSRLAASTEQMVLRRIPPIYATLGTVLERTTFQECCRA
jgi:hypothetical protein